MSKERHTIRGARPAIVVATGLSVVMIIMLALWLVTGTRSSATASDQEDARALAAEVEHPSGRSVADEQRQYALTKLRLHANDPEVTRHGRFTASLHITNLGDHRVKDIVVTCPVYARSGTLVDVAEATIFEVVSPDSDKDFKRFDFGYIHSQGVRAECRATELVFADEHTAENVEQVAASVAAPASSSAVLKDESFEVSNGYLKVRGRVVNAGSSPLQGVKVEVRIFDLAGNVVGKRVSYATSEILLAGEADNFEIIERAPDDMARYEARIVE